MSLSDDEEALFDDIYGSDDDSKKQETTKKTELETKESESKSETPNDDTNKVDNHDDDDDEKKVTSKENTNELNESNESTTQPLEQSQSQNTSVNETNDSNSLSQPPLPSTTSQSADSYNNNSQFQQQSTPNGSFKKVDLSRDAGKMFIGGLDWDTTEERMKEYFSKFGEVIDHTIMRESSTGRSRGFGFLTFANSSSVDEVVKTQHVLDGKVIDPKRAIPREEQDKTGKIFVGGIAPEVRPKDFEEFFGKFGTIIDAQLMLDKDTGRSRGFGFVTFDAPEAVDRVCQGRYLDFNGRQIEVKRAEPRGPQQQQNHIQQQQQRYLQQQGFSNPAAIPSIPNQPMTNPAVTGGGSGGGGGSIPTGANGAFGQLYGGMTPEAMTLYWQQMQQYWMQFQQQQQAGQSTPALPQNLQNLAQQFAQSQSQQQQQQQQQQGEGQVQNGIPPPPPSSAPEPYDNDGSYGNYRRRGAPYGAPRGPRGGPNGGSGRGGRGRGRGGYNRNEFHPYSRN